MGCANMLVRIAMTLDLDKNKGSEETVYKENSAVLLCFFTACQIINKSNSHRICENKVC